MKKTISCILILILCLAVLTGCNKDKEIPDGMYSATVAGEPFILYVPEGWVDNRDSGISSAYYSLDNAVTVSARYYPAPIPEGGAFSLDEYVDKMVEDYHARYTSFKLVDRKLSALDESNAIRLEYTFLRSITSNNTTVEADVTVMQYYVHHGDDVVVLSMYCKTEAYAVSEEYPEMFEMIRSEFRLCERAEINDVVTDKDTPEGLKRISPDGAQYRFYAPTSWVTNMSDKMTEAYYPESGRPNISVTAFSPDDSEITPEKYFELCQDSYKKDIPGYSIDEEAEPERRELAGRSAVVYSFSANYGGTEYKFMQALLKYNDLIYSITYTAPADSFDAHIDDVELMLTSFKFR